MPLSGAAAGTPLASHIFVYERRPKMTSILVRKENRGPASAPDHAVARSLRWTEPRWMRELLDWDPFGEVAPLMRTHKLAIDFAPAFDLKEGKEAFQIVADLPGVKNEDLEISLIANHLSIRGKRDAETEDRADTFYVYERSFGSFLRSFTLPEGIDSEHIRAQLDEGVLRVIFPKRPHGLSG
jgi:HSP20 family protein